MIGLLLYLSNVFIVPMATSGLCFTHGGACVAVTLLVAQIPQVDSQLVEFVVA